MKTKKSKAIQDDFEAQIGELAQKIINKHCDEVLHKVKITLRALSTDIKNALAPLKKLSREYGLNIDSDQIESDDTSLTVNVRFSIDMERLVKREKVKALKAHLDKVNATNEM